MLSFFVVSFLQAVKYTVAMEYPFEINNIRVKSHRKNIFLTRFIENEMKRRNKNIKKLYGKKAKLVDEKDFRITYLSNLVVKLVTLHIFSPTNQ